MGNRKIGWNDQKQMNQRAGGGDLNKYRAQMGVPDVIRLVDANPFMVRSHYLDDLGRGFTCSKTWDADKDSYVGPCPLCEEGHKATDRFAVKIVHIARGKEMQKKFRIWQFGVDKYQLLSGIAKVKDKPLNEVELSIICLDEKYQKLQIIPLDKLHKVTADPSSDFDIDKVTAVPTYEKLVSQLEAARGGGGSAVVTEDIADEIEQLTEETVPAATGGEDTIEDDDDFDIGELLKDG